MSDRLSVLDTELVFVPIINPVANGLPFVPTALAVEMAFPVGNADPVTGDWNAAIWQATPDYPYAVACWVGPDGVPLTIGKWWPWVKIATSPGPVIMRALGMITVS